MKSIISLTLSKPDFSNKAKSLVPMRSSCILITVRSGSEAHDHDGAGAVLRGLLLRLSCALDRPGKALGEILSPQSAKIFLVHDLFIRIEGDEIFCGKTRDGREPICSFFYVSSGEILDHLKPLLVQQLFLSLVSVDR